jgi:large conductance mechanosensitive channel
MGEKSSLIQEFKTFVLRGNVVDLAVGVVMGAAFGALVTSLVQDIVTPLLGIFGTPDFKDLVFKVGKGEFRLGLFLNAVISLLLIALAVFFFIIKPINKLSERRRPGTPVEASVRDCPYCLSSIPKKATRCSYCTSEVTPVAEAPREEAIDSP